MDTNPAPISATDAQRAKSRRLFQYLREVSRLRDKPVRDISKYEQVLWLADLPTELPGVLSALDAHADPAGEWLSLARPGTSTPPVLPDVLAPWVDAAAVARFADDLEIADSISVVVESPEGVDASDEEAIKLVEVRLDEDDEAGDAWVAYEQLWLHWAAERRRIQPHVDAYHELFTMQQRAEQLGEEYDLVLGVGLLTWVPGSGAVRRHLVTVPAVINFDESTARLSVEGSTELGHNIRFEQDMLEPREQPIGEVIATMQERLADCEGPFDRDVVDDVLAQWAHSADGSGRYEPMVGPDSPASDSPVVSFAPALILRRRGSRSLEQTYGSIIEQLDQGGDVPVSVVDLIESTGGNLGPEETASWGGDDSGADEAVYFPLPANDDQRRIVAELGRRRGVVVQGPPGTGKSHTIANLISHALASGKRVLVTSHTQRALEVLRDKLPEEIRNLSVSVLGEGKAGSEDLKNSATVLLSRRSDPEWAPERVEERLETAEAKLVSAKETLADAKADLAKAAAARSHAVTFAPGYHGTAGEVAQMVAEKRSTHEWYPDVAAAEAPLSADDLQRVRELRAQAASFEADDVHCIVPPADSLWPAQAFADFAAQLHAARSNARPEPLAPDVMDGIEQAVDQDRTGLDEKLAALVAAQRLVVGADGPAWHKELAADIAGGNVSTWKARLQAAVELDEYLGSVRSTDLTGPASTVPDVDRSTAQRLGDQAERVKDHLGGGGRLRNRLGFRPRAIQSCEELLLGALEDRPVESETELHHAYAKLRLTTALLGAEAQWLDVLDQNAPSFAARIDAVRRSAAHVRSVFAWIDRRNEVADALGVGALARDIDAACLYAAVERVEQANALNAMEEKLTELVGHIQAIDANAQTHPAVTHLAIAVRRLAVKPYAEHLDQMARARQVQKLMAELRVLEAQLRSAPNLAAGLDTEFAGYDAAEVVDAWAWKRATGELARLTGDSDRPLHEAVRRAAQAEADALAEIGGIRAWQAALERLSPAEETSIKAYQGALKRLGKGTGKRANQHRAAARKHLDNCQSAIPAWIMPTYRVAETVAAAPDSFDLVIVDEASQSGVDALFLMWLGKQIVVVGDDEQISPSNVGIKEADVDALQRKYLADFELRDHLDIFHSLFDQAKVRYSGEIWLTEHFRCMPEIIEFSNRQIYAPQQRRLEPLRQFGSNRLTPLRRVHVPGGSVEGKGKVNQAEADALVAQLLDCHDDPTYAERTFGVITLLGSDQSKYIEGRLLEALPQEAWRDRKLRVGDAYDFQGDERDIVFLSMVAAPGDGENVLRKLGNARGADQRRFNVAASRACDQMWLFHSVTTSQLNGECLRAALLRHFEEPPVLDTAPHTGDVPSDILVEPFDSLFEQRVFNELRNRGYAVAAQVKTYGRRIDLVVLGAGTKLAVECDGAAFHGPDEFEADLNRQRDLERVGWVFERVRDTDFYLDRDAAMEPVFERLAQLDIHPMGLGEPVVEDPFPAAQPAIEIVELDDPIDLEVVEAQASVEPCEADDLPANELPTVDFAPAPYKRWSDDGARAVDLGSRIVDIVAVEGPMTMSRLVQLATGSGALEPTSAVKSAIQDCDWAGRLVTKDLLGVDGLVTVRLPEQPEVSVRDRGPRMWPMQMPPAEVAGVVVHLRSLGSDSGDLVDAVLAHYGVQRRTQQTEEFVARCEALSGVREMV